MAAIWRFGGSNSLARRYSRSASSRLSARFGHAGRVEVNLRGADHRALERDPVFGVVGIGLDRAAVVIDRRLPVAGPGGVISSAERAAGGTPGRETGDDDQRGDSERMRVSLS